MLCNKLLSLKSGMRQCGSYVASLKIHSYYTKKHLDFFVAGFDVPNLDVQNEIHHQSPSVLQFQPLIRKIRYFLLPTYYHLTIALVDREL